MYSMGRSMGGAERHGLSAWSRAWAAMQHGQRGMGGAEAGHRGMGCAEAG
jgi:hypothetical protein